MQIFDINDKTGCKTFFKEHGWLHIENVFSKEEIEKFRESSYLMKQQKYKGDVLAFPATSSLIYDDRIINLVKLLLVTDKPVYFG